MHSTDWKKKEEEKPGWLRDKSYFLSASCLTRRCCPAICPESAGTEQRCDGHTKSLCALPAPASPLPDPLDAACASLACSSATLKLFAPSCAAGIFCWNSADPQHPRGFGGLESTASRGVWGLVFILSWDHSIPGGLGVGFFS